MLTGGTRIGPYEIVAPIGAGGMGEVYRARDSRLGRDVALKVLPAAFAAHADRLARFEQEARATGALNHPNILAIFEFGTHEGMPYIVSELLEGETLRTRLALGALPFRKAAEVAAQVARGLAAAHDKGITHRDLKPENLFVTKDGRVKVFDFGLAKVTRPESIPGEVSSLPTTPAGTDAGLVMGTVGYMSPEQVRGKPADGRSDLFALGAILYEMLSGRRAFTGESAVETMNAILKEDPPDLGTADRTIPPSIERLVRHCLEKNPEERFQSARDVAFDLEALAGPGSTGSGATAIAAPDGRRGLRREAVIGLLAAAGGAVLVLAAAHFGAPLARFLPGALAARGAGGAGGVGGAGGEAALSPVTFAQKTYSQLAIFNALYAPDGKTIVYSGALEGNRPIIFTLRPEYPEPVALGTQGIHLLSISRKGEMAVLTGAQWLGHRLFYGTLARMPLGGGAPREILENVRQADWAPDGERLAIIRDANGKDRLEFPIGRVLYECSGYLSDLRVSPKGDRIAFFEHPTKFDDRGSVAVVDLEGHKTTLSEGYWGEEGIAWSQDGGEIFFSAGTGYVNFAIFGVTLAGRLRTALQSAGGMLILDVAPDGHWLVTRDDIRRDTFVRAPGQATEKDLSWLDITDVVALSRDGKTLLMTEQGATAGVNYQVALRKTDGSPVIRLGEGNAGDLSPDGRWAVAAIPTDPDRLILYPTGAGEPRQLPSGPIRTYQGGLWSRDGRTLILGGAESGHAPRCYLQSLDGGDPKPVTPEGTALCLLSPDGASVIAGSSTNDFKRYPVAGSAPTEVTVVKPDEEIVRWNPDGRSLLVRRHADVPARIERVDLATGRREQVALLGPADRAGVVQINAVAFSEDMTAYAYSCLRYLSHLFVVDGVR